MVRRTFPTPRRRSVTRSLYPPEKLQLPPNVPANLEAKVRREAQGYYAHCSALDECIGAVMATLASVGLADNTILVFTSDHGEMLGAHGGQPYLKQVAWDESAHVPLSVLAGAPWTTRESDRDGAHHARHPAHVAGACRHRRAQKRGGGGSLRPDSRRARAADRAALYMAVAPFGGGAFNWEYRAIRTSRYTYVRRLSGPWLLFDDGRNPTRETTCSASPSSPPAGLELDQRLKAELKKIGDETPPRPNIISRLGATK